jgi:hypothetical protein
MKKLGKLNITPEKVMKNEELGALRGGVGTKWVYCFPNKTSYVSCQFSVSECPPDNQLKQKCEEACGGTFDRGDCW